MYMYVCMYVCMCVCVCMYVCMYVYMYVRMYVCMFAHISLIQFIFACVCSYHVNISMLKLLV